MVDGQIQIGQAESSYEPMAAVYDAGGTVWETNETFASLDELFDEMERRMSLGDALPSRFCQEQGIELADRQGNVIPWLKI